MNYSLIIGFIISAIIFFAFFIFLAKKINPEFKDYLTLLIALFALLGSIFVGFRDKFEKFDISIISNQIILTNLGSTLDDIGIILPITFINKSYGNGVIEWFAIKVINTNDILNPQQYEPQVEVDYPKFLTERKEGKVPAKSIFTSFYMKQKESILKHILLSRKAGDENYPGKGWSIGKYKFEIYVKIAENDKPHLYETLEVNIDEKRYNSLLIGHPISIFLINMQI